MNCRERFHETMHFGNPDRPPYWEFGPWPQTLERWHDEGMPEDVHLEQFFGLDRREIYYFGGDLIPLFREETIEETDRHIIRRRPDGVITRALKEGLKGGTYLSMDQHIQFPVRDRQTWNEFKKRLDPRSPLRYHQYPEEYARSLRGRDYPLFIYGLSLFGWPRNWMGIETVSTMFYDDPTLMHDIMDHVADLSIEIITPALAAVGDMDFGFLWEDMGFKTASIISPKLVREFMLPRYKRITDVFHKYGVDIITLDSDGHVDELIPIWLEAGINCIYPLEVAAGSDPVALRKKYGKDLLMYGGIDKRALARDKKAIDEELYKKVPFLVEQGGWIPGIDHSIPPDVPYENFVYYRELVRKICEGG